MTTFNTDKARSILGRTYATEIAGIYHAYYFTNLLLDFSTNEAQWMFYAKHTITNADGYSNEDSGLYDAEDILNEIERGLLK